MDQLSSESNAISSEISIHSSDMEFEFAIANPSLEDKSLFPAVPTEIVDTNISYKILHEIGMVSLV